MDDGTPSSSSDSEMSSKIKKSFVKNCHATFDKDIKMNCLYPIIDDDDLFNNRSKRPTFVISQFLINSQSRSGQIISPET